VEDVEHYPRHFRATAQSVGVQVRQLIAVPLVAHGSAIGVLEVLNRTSVGPYSQEDADLLLAFAAQAAVAIENARLYGELVRERDHILAVEAGVRRELARDLHDGPAQMLSTLVITARYLQELLRRDPRRIGEELDELETLALKAMHQVRNILFDLRPVILEEQGLGPTLEQYVSHLRMVEPFAVKLVAPSLHSRFPTRVESAIFSIVQEAVNNAKKHARPRNVTIGGVEKGDMLIISIRDDGQGFDVTQTLVNYAERGSFGLLNMRERAEIAQGTLQIKSRPGKGTTVTLSVPLNSRTGEQAGMAASPTKKPSAKR
jgi:signal transduction histidine kinase